jgi:hypothetical protein
MLPGEDIVRMWEGCEIPNPLFFVECSLEKCNQLIPLCLNCEHARMTEIGEITIIE